MLFKLIMCHLIFSTILFVSIFSVKWCKYYNITRITKLSIWGKIKGIMFIMALSYAPILNLCMLYAIIQGIRMNEDGMLALLNKDGVMFKQKYKKLPIGFWENIPVYNGDSTYDPDDSIPLELSDEVLSGKRKLKVTLPKKD